MTSIRFLPEEVAQMQKPLLQITAAVEAADELVTTGDVETARAYLEVIRASVRRLNELESKMSEPIPL